MLSWPPDALLGNWRRSCSALYRMPAPSSSNGVLLDVRCPFGQTTLSWPLGAILASRRSPTHRRPHQCLPLLLPFQALVVFLAVRRFPDHSAPSDCLTTWPFDASRSLDALVGVRCTISCSALPETLGAFLANRNPAVRPAHPGWAWSLPDCMAPSLVTWRTPVHPTPF